MREIISSHLKNFKKFIGTEIHEKWSLVPSRSATRINSYPWKPSEWRPILSSRNSKLTKDKRRKCNVVPKFVDPFAFHGHESLLRVESFASDDKRLSGRARSNIFRLDGERERERSISGAIKVNVSERVVYLGRRKRWRIYKCRAVKRMLTRPMLLSFLSRAYTRVPYSPTFLILSR